MSGLSRIFSFPFRIYGAPFLPALSGIAADRQHQVRIYPPFLVRVAGMPLSPDVPFDRWPGFQWSSTAPEHERIPPPQIAPRPGLGPRVYDSLRVDFWGPDAHNFGLRFEPMFLSWLRLLTGQEWIGEYEPHTDTHVKYEFAIDSEGSASGAPYGLGRAITPSAHMRPLAEDIWRSAFANSLQNEPPPVYWMLWQDAAVHRAADHIREACLALTLSLEVARDSLFPKFASTRNRPGVGAVLTSPFDGTDLLEHLAGALQKVHNRNLKVEEPATWGEIKQLYVARHHVAHGREPIVRDSEKSRLAEDADLIRWMQAVRRTLLWMETL